LSLLFKEFHVRLGRNFFLSITPFLCNIEWFPEIFQDSPSSS